MEHGVKLFGHSVHPMLIVFPLGLLSTAVVFDLIYFASANPAFPVVAYWLIAAGIIGGLIAAIFGLIDWLAIPSGTRAKTIGIYHAVVNLVVVLLFAGSLYLRRVSAVEPPLSAMILSFLGVALALVIGYGAVRFVTTVYSDPLPFPYNLVSEDWGSKKGGQTASVPKQDAAPNLASSDKVKSRRRCSRTKSLRRLTNLEPLNRHRGSAIWRYMRVGTLTR